jgi:hypothetical protein
MSIRRQIITSLIRTYPEAWRREYGPELADILLASGLGPRVVANVLWSALRQRARVLDMTHLWVRAAVAFVAMEALFATSSAVWYAFGSGRETPIREFPGAFSYGLFAAVVASPFCMGALLGAILPLAACVRSFGRSFSAPTTILLGAALSLPAFAVVVLGGWLLEEPHLSLTAFVTNVLRFPRSNVLILGACAVGGAIVLSGQRKNRQARGPRRAPAA